ncbi:MAG: hypothetical protein U1C59_06460, partial [Methylotenera sp.]|nr:hypothetical protein [Methylotenera sp.]
LVSLIIPLLVFLLIFLSEHNEKRIAAISFWGSHALGVSVAALLGLWAIKGFPHWEYEWFTLYAADDYRFTILFYLDTVGAV